MGLKYKSKELPGFPVTFKFKTLEEVNEYLGEERVQCLLCGRWFSMLGIHIPLKHKIDIDEYREMYGIPWTRGLDCKAQTKRRVAEAHARMAKNVSPKFFDAEARTAVIAGRHTHKRKRQEATNAAENMNWKKYNKKMGFNGEEFARRKAMPKLGTPEHHARLSAAAKKRGAALVFARYWEGKKQTEDHVAKRMRRLHGGEDGD